MRKIDWRHPASLWLHWEVWQYHRSIDKSKGLQVTEKVRSYEKGTKLRKRYEVTKKVRSYEKGTKLRKKYEVKKKVRSYEHGTKLRKGYEVTKKVRKRYEDVTKYVTKGLGYEVTKLRDSNATYQDDLLWRIVMNYGEMPRATLGLNDLRSQVAIFGEWNIYGTRKKIFC